MANLSCMLQNPSRIVQNVVWEIYCEINRVVSGLKKKKLLSFTKITKPVYRGTRKL